MTDWLALTLLSAFSLATADAMSKRFLHRYRAREIVIIRFAVTGLLLAPLLLVQPLPSLPLPFWGWIGALLPVEILAMLCYMVAIRDSPLALTLPYLAFTPVFTTLTGYVLLDERVSASGLAGILLVVAGAWLLNIEHLRTAQRHTWAAPFGAMLHQRGAQLMLIVAGLYSLSSVMGKGAMQYAPPTFFGPFYFCVLGVVTLALFSLRQPAIGRVIWRHPFQHLLIGIAMAVMVMTHFLAIRQVEVAYMIAVKRTSLLFGIAYGAVLFGETRVLAHLLAGALMVAGVACIALQPF